MFKKYEKVFFFLEFFFLEANFIYEINSCYMF